ncbi:MAG: DUF1499 domain-containing protein [Deltaproteobacteria bacterium]|nr:DUF1499 domain-containing protein [Deltaproteobacteria bacterium]
MSRYWLLCLVVMMVGCSGNRHSQMGVTVGRLAACPDSPNCVSSQSADRRHAIDPLRYEGTAEKARERLVEAVSGMKRARIVAAEERYLHAEFTSAFFRFVDDVEFLLDDGTKTIHVRSASRVGYSDLGVNRRRVEEIRSRFDALNKERT